MGRNCLEGKLLEGDVKGGNDSYKGDLTPYSIYLYW